MKFINPFLFFKRRKSKLMVIVIIMSISVLCVFFVSSVMSFILSSSTDVVLTPLETFSIASYDIMNGNKDKNEVESFIDTAIKDKAMRMEVIFQTTDFNMLVGSTSSYVLLAEQANMTERLLDGLSLTMDDGRRPQEGKNEIVVHKDILKNKGLNIGDQLLNCTITGSFDGNCRISVGALSADNWSSYQAGRISYLIFPLLNSNVTEINHLFEEITDKNWSFYTYEIMSSEIENDMSQFCGLILIVTGLVSYAVSIAVAALVFSIYASRYDEYAILNSIGLTKATIGINILLEIVVLSLVSWVVGYALSLLVTLFVNRFVLYDMGQAVPFFNLDSLLYSLILPILTIVITTFTVIRKLKRTDLITIIERR